MRLVSLCPSTTELLFDLGVGDTLVGVTRFCIHPTGGVAAVHKIGGTKNPSIDEIAALQPDLVLLNEEENRREDWEALRDRGIACHLSFPRDASGAAALVSDLGRLVDRQARAATIVTGIAEARREVAVDRPSTRFAYLIWRKPWMTVNSDTYISAILEEAGGINVFGNNEVRYPEITAELLALEKPDRVLLSSEPFPFKEKHMDELATATGLPREVFALVDGENLSWHGSRTARGLRYAREVLAPA